MGYVGGGRLGGDLLVFAPDASGAEDGAEESGSSHEIGLSDGGDEEVLVEGPEGLNGEGGELTVGVMEGCLCMRGGGVIGVECGHGGDLLGELDIEGGGSGDEEAIDGGDDAAIEAEVFDDLLELELDSDEGVLAASSALLIEAEEVIGVVFLHGSSLR
jgi:hypothetical protein